jgi:hypothetical protein
VRDTGFRRYDGQLTVSVTRFRRRAAFSRLGGWYHWRCGENCLHARHWVIDQSFRHPGHNPRVQNVFQTVPHFGSHAHRSSGAGRQRHLGHQISSSSRGIVRPRVAAP